jgi:hypothetical protein
MDDFVSSVLSPSRIDESQPATLLIQPILWSQGLYGLIRQLAHTTRAFQSALHKIPHLSSITQARERISSVHLNVSKTLDDAHPLAAQELASSSLRTIQQEIALLLKAETEPRAIPLFEQEKNEMVQLCRTYWNCWGEGALDDAEFSAIALLDVLDYLLLANAFDQASPEGIDQYSRGDTAWREEIPEQAWRTVSMIRADGYLPTLEKAGRIRTELEVNALQSIASSQNIPKKTRLTL